MQVQASLYLQFCISSGIQLHFYKQEVKQHHYNMHNYHFLLLLLLHNSVIYVYECIFLCDCAFVCVCREGSHQVSSPPVLELRHSSGWSRWTSCRCHCAAETAVIGRSHWSASQAAGLTPEHSTGVNQQITDRQSKPPCHRGLPPQTSWPCIAPPLSGNLAG